MKLVLRVLCLLLCCHATLAQEKTTSTARSQNTEEANEGSESANPSAAKLPVRRVVLYKNGVGYFEHLGRVRGSQDVHVDFASAQLNDVLKSLTVLDLSGRRRDPGRSTTSARHSTARWRSQHGHPGFRVRGPRCSKYPTPFLYSTTRRTGDRKSV